MSDVSRKNYCKIMQNEQEHICRECIKSPELATVNFGKMQILEDTASKTKEGTASEMKE